jgi:hypothetical protein
MTRSRSDKPRNAPVERPEPLGRLEAAARAIDPTASLEYDATPLLGYARPRYDYWPEPTDPADVRAIRQAERSRAEALAADPEWWTGEGRDE